MATGSHKLLWTATEDRLLYQLVLELGAARWTTIAKAFNNRTGKQCRERWFNHVSPAVNKDNWTIEEEELLIRLVDTHGTHWAQISHHFPGRADNAIKNRFCSLVRHGKATKPSSWRRTIQKARKPEPKEQNQQQQQQEQQDLETTKQEAGAKQQKSAAEPKRASRLTTPTSPPRPQLPSIMSLFEALDRHSK